MFNEYVILISECTFGVMIMCAFGLWSGHGDYSKLHFSCHFRLHTGLCSEIIPKALCGSFALLSVESVVYMLGLSCFPM